MRRLYRLCPLLTLTIFVFAACQPIGPATGGASTPTSEATATMAAETPTPQITSTEEMSSTEGMTGTQPMSGTTGNDATGNTVQVSLKEYSIEMETSLSAGMTTFQVTNNGSTEHSFSIEGQGIDESLTANLQPGETGTLQVDLQAGDYTAYCPVDEHEGKGMKATFTVQ